MVAYRDCVEEKENGGGARELFSKARVNTLPPIFICQLNGSHNYIINITLLSNPYVSSAH